MMLLLKRLSTNMEIFEDYLFGFEMRWVRKSILCVQTSSNIQGQVHPGSAFSHKMSQSRIPAVFCWNVPAVLLKEEYSVVQIQDACDNFRNSLS